MSHTFDSLTNAKNRELKALMKTGAEPALEELLGFEFQGWNNNATTRFTGTRKFKKGFFGMPGRDLAWGYNVAVEQNSKSEPWIPKKKDGEIVRHYFFGICSGRNANRPKYRDSLVVDYRKSRSYFALNPVRNTVDYLVYPNAGDKDLVLGVSYWEGRWLKPFLGYFILRRDDAPADYATDSHFLTRRERETVKAFAEVFIDGGDEEILTPEEVMWNVDRHLSGIRSNRTRSIGLALFVIEHLVPRRSLWPFRRAFSKMSPEARKEFIQTRLHDARNRGILRDLGKIRTLIAAGYYGDPRVNPKVGFEPVEDRFPASDRVSLDKGAPNLITHAGGDLVCDVCVIGSGAGGAVVAHNAARELGRDVLVLEEGPYVAPSDLSHDEREMTTRLYKEGGLQATVDLDMYILQGQCVGGSTVINNTICFRLNDPLLLPPRTPDLLDRWALRGAKIDRDKLNESFDRVSAAINVRPLDADIAGTNADVLLRGIQALTSNGAPGDFKHGLFAKNYDRCLGCGHCVYGCPYQRKMSALEAFLLPASQGNNPVRVLPGCHAIKIETDGSKATGVRCELRDGTKFTVRAKSVVVSCGAIGSSVLLMKSDLGSHVGSRFSFNAGTPMFARFPDPALAAYDGVQMAAYVDAGDYMLESLFYPPMTFSAIVPGWFRDHFDRMKEYDHFACAGVLIGTEPNAHVKSWSLSRNLIGPVSWSRMADTDRENLLQGMTTLVEVFFAAGADAVYPATFVDFEIKKGQYASRREIYDELAKRILKKEDLTISTAHPQGGNPMGSANVQSVVDDRFRVHGYPNLFVADASVFPTTIGINPQLTIMAMADYFTRLGDL